MTARRQKLKSVFEAIAEGMLQRKDDGGIGRQIHDIPGRMTLTGIAVKSACDGLRLKCAGAAEEQREKSNWSFHVS